MDKPKPMKELTRIREERRLSQQGLADASGVNKATINQIERGRRSPNLETLEKLAAALGVEMADLFPKAQTPLPLQEEDAWRQGWQSIARCRSDLLERAAELWDVQLDKGQYDWQTLKAIETVGFLLALNHDLDEEEMKRWLTREQLAQLERAEKRYETHEDKIVGVLRDAAEEEKKRLSEAEVIDLERYVAQREAARRQLSGTA